MNREEARKELYKWLTEYYNKIYSKKTWQMTKNMKGSIHD